MAARGTRPGSLTALTEPVTLRVEKSVRTWLEAESERRDVAIGQVVREALDAAKKREEAKASRRATREDR